MQKPWKYNLIVVLFFIILSGIGVILRIQILIDSYAGRIFTEVEHVPKKDVALVFGAHVYSDGRLSDALRDRVSSAVDLYNAGAVQKMVMTGDNGRKEYDEVTAMKAYASELGVPEEDIVLDYAGFRTYDSCYRARDVFGLHDIIVVSQEFHLPRVLYICNRLGVESIGYRADKHTYAPARWWSVREFLARCKAWLEVELFRHKPTYLGENVSVL